MQTNIHYRRQKDTVTLTFSAELEGKPPTLDLDASAIAVHDALAGR